MWIQPFGTDLSRLTAQDLVSLRFRGVNHLNSPRIRTPRPVFLDGTCNSDPVISYKRLAAPSFDHPYFLPAANVLSVKFHALFNPIPGCFSTFLHSTTYAIGLGLYLDLAVGFCRIHAANPGRITLDTYNCPLRFRIWGFHPLWRCNPARFFYHRWDRVVGPNSTFPSHYWSDSV